MKHLRIYSDALRLVALTRPLWTTLAKNGQRDLSRQLKRCAPSVALNIAEGAGRYDGNGRLRFETAMGSARETIACLEVAVAMGATGPAEVAEAVDCADKVVATLWNITKRRRA